MAFLDVMLNFGGHAVFVAFLRASVDTLDVPVGSTNASVGP